MSKLTLVRHAQASIFADNYDELSELGRKQAQMLGDYIVRRQVHVDAVFCGPKVRQQQTAEIVGGACEAAGQHWPDPVCLQEFDEYDLVSIFRALAPDLARQDADFAELLASYRRDEKGPDRLRSFQRMFEALTAHWATTVSELANAETFSTFRHRVERGLNRAMDVNGSGKRVIVFTSGGVIGTSVRLALDAPDRSALEVNWRVRNCSLTEFVFTKGRFNLDSFNTVPHLEDSTLWTYW